jgi:tryptophanyl-tRNA synthetase
MRRLMGDETEIDRVLRSGAEKARAVAEPIMRDVKKTVGFVV